MFKNMLAVIFYLCFGLIVNAQDNSAAESVEQYIDFLETALASETVSIETTAQYYSAVLQEILCILDV
jgi:hypothetical protein